MDNAQYWFQAPAGGVVIGNSLRFRGAQYLSKQFTTAGDRKLWTLSLWLKRANLDDSADHYFYSVWETSAAENSHGVGFLSAGQELQAAEVGTGSVKERIRTTSSYRDPSAWFHLVLVYDVNAAAGGEDYLRFYINGERVTNTKDRVSTTDWAGTTGDTGNVNVFGRRERSGGSGVSYFDGYMAEVHMVSGQGLNPTDFGEFNADGVWVPKDVTGLTYGTNGFYLDFSDPADIGADRSGNGNNFTPTGFELTTTTSNSYDWMADSPTKNWATFNKVLGTGRQSNLTYSEGNLQVVSSATSGSDTTAVGTIAVTGKKYCEFTLPSDADGVYIGVMKADTNLTNSGIDTSANSNCWICRGDNGNKCNNSSVSYGSTFANNDVIMLAIDVDNTSIWWGKNGTWFASGDPAANSNAAFTNLPSADDLLVICGDNYSTRTPTIVANFGQRDFAYTPPTGFEALNTADLPAVAITNPSDHFTTLLSGNFPVQPAPAAPGDAYGGGFYAGQIKDGAKVYNLIVAPKTSGGLVGESPGPGIQWKNSESADSPSATFQNEVHGAGATVAGADGNHAMFNWAVNGSTGPNAGNYDATNTAGTGIGGFNDWYIPAKHELEILYRNLKPSTTANNTGNTVNPQGYPNPYAVPPTSNYTAADPAQTTNALFQVGGSEAFNSATTYWSATESSSDTKKAAEKSFNTGSGNQASKLNDNYLARAVRREFAYDAGILDYAQATFPNGLWWIKDRVNAEGNKLVDSVNGDASALIQPNTSDTPYSVGAYIAPTGNSLAYCWATPASGINTTAGFSITSGTHGLGAAPEFVIDRGMNAWHKDLPAGQGLRLWIAAPSTAQAWTVNSTTVSGPGGGSYYSWRSVPGLSAFGSYTANGNADGAFCYTGFRVGWLLVKRVGGTTMHGTILNSAANTYNPTSRVLYTGSNVAEQTGTYCNVDLLSNGFKLRTAWDYLNESGQYVWAAFAEHPFGGSNVSPSPAR